MRDPGERVAVRSRLKVALLIGAYILYLVVFKIGNVKRGLKNENNSKITTFY